MEMQEWLDATNNTVILWSHLDLERVSVENNLKKLQSLEQKLPEEKYRIDDVRNFAERVIPGTSDEGKANIRKQIDSSQQDWEMLGNGIRYLYKNLTGA